MLPPSDDSEDDDSEEEDPADVARAGELAKELLEVFKRLGEDSQKELYKKLTKRLKKAIEEEEDDEPAGKGGKAPPGYEMTRKERERLAAKQEAEAEVPAEVKAADMKKLEEVRKRREEQA